MEEQVEMKTFESGAKSTVEMPRFDLLEPELLVCTADRLAYGAARHGVRNWMKGLEDKDWLRDRMNHMQHHLLQLQLGREPWENLGALGCGVMFQAVAHRRGKV